MSARFVVGIDLGTSNSALAYAELDEVRSARRPVIHQFEVPQLVAPGHVQPRRLLPSSLYAPAGFELTPEQTNLPWRTLEVPDEEAERKKLRLPSIVGEAAKKLGAKTPVRLIESSKSWLCHGGVNRTAAILPWHAPDGVPKLSPVEAATSLLEHLREAWDHEFAREEPSAALAAQHIVITVPASFDEVARELTLTAARKAGFNDVHLIEEPLAAFYAYIARTGGTSAATGLSGGERVLIADVGGGTTDFTLVDVRPPDDDDGVLTFERSAVGDHLLLGGDNMDLALAHAVEPALRKGGRLNAEAWAQLKLECRLAKETLFSNPDVSELPIVVTGRGSKLIGGTMRTTLTQATLEQVLIDGYYPELPAGDAARPQQTSATVGFAEYGLPYAQDPAITRHLAAFLLRHAAEGEPVAKVDALLFNGGALKPTRIRDRISRVLGQWLRSSAGGAVRDPRPLIYDEGDEALELAVARGAAYFALAREGLGVKVAGGSPREYFLGLGLEPGESVPEGHVKVVCVAPRGMQDGQRIEVPDREFMLLTNRPVRFPIYATTSPRKDPVGSVVVLAQDDLHQLPPLETVVRFGKQRAGTKVGVRLQVQRTELGTLELSCLSRMSGARFKLAFDLRAAGGLDDAPPNGAPEHQAASPPNSDAGTGPNGAGDPSTGADPSAGIPEDPSSSQVAPSGVAAEPFGGAGTRAPPEVGDIDPTRIEAAKQRLSAVFAPEPPRPDPDTVMKGLEEDLGVGRDGFPLGTLRVLAEHLLELADHRGASAAIETRWLNLVGFCLRPGFGVAVDDWRVKQLWKIHAQDVLHPSHDAAEMNWWILWRRVAGGLGRGPQQELAARLFPLLIPSLAKRAKKKPPKPQTQLSAEMWRAAAALERLGAKSRAQLGDTLVELIETKKGPRGALWCLGRIGARKLLYGPREATVRPAIVMKWIDRLMAAKRLPKDEHPAPAMIAMARLTGDRHFDLEEGQRKKIGAFLAGRGLPDELHRPLFEVVQVDQQTQVAALGDTLPTGLSLT